MDRLGEIMSCDSWQDVLLEGWHETSCRGEVDLLLCWCQGIRTTERAIRRYCWIFTGMFYVDPPAPDTPTLKGGATGSLGGSDETSLVLLPKRTICKLHDVIVTRLK
jgi:hypothetical protein